jgi:A/G-specific adenine glycosylase
MTSRRTKKTPDPFSPAFRRRLLAWYRRHARDLPWRRTRDPYAIWVSEVMLQQTQVATVVPYFERFLARFPTLAALAGAGEEDVLRLWEGLGYYRRARQMHRAAQIIVAEHNGRFPRDAETLRRLPGIGRYTAGAILSIAFDAREPVLEANTLRLLSRLLAYRGNPRSAAGQRLLWQTARELLPRAGAGVFNQALMELGATLCTSRAPHCEACPVATFCRARETASQHQIPIALRRRDVEEVHQAAVVVLCRNKVLLLKREEGQRWAGLWDFPRFEVNHRTDGRAAEVRDKLHALFGLKAQALSHVTTLRHSVTRFRIRLDCFVARANPQTRFAPTAKLNWFGIDELSQLPLSTTGRQLARIVEREMMNGSFSRGAATVNSQRRQPLDTRRQPR